VKALISLMLLKQKVENPNIIRQINSILIPMEYTRLDQIIEILFSTAEDIKEEEQAEEPGAGETGPRFTPVSFHESCIERLQKKLSLSLVKKTRASYISADGSTAFVCAVSKEHLQGEQTRYWYLFHPYQKEFLEKFSKGFIAFGCGSAGTLVLISKGDFFSWLDSFNKSEKEDGFVWHVHIVSEKGKLWMVRKQGGAAIDLSPYKIPA
jgi:hypothetical protein